MDANPDGSGSVAPNAGESDRLAPNLDGTGRVVRGVAGVWLLAGALSAFRAGRRTLAATAGVAGVGLLGNALGGFCGLNRLAGIDLTANDDA